jgi:hypothetical protein
VNDSQPGPTAGFITDLMLAADQSQDKEQWPCK